MNYLAHLYLAEDTPASRIGNLLGDFVTGRPESIALPPAVVAGIIRHRAIDRFSDEHPAVARARTLVAGPRRRFANAILDICFDHFLTREWPAPPPLRTFLDQVNAELLAHRRWLPTALDVGLEARIADDWLGHYGSEAGLQEVFDRVAARRPACAAIAGALDDFRAHRAAFSAAFTVLLSDLRRFLENLGPERLYLGTEGGQG